MELVRYSRMSNCVWGLGECSYYLGNEDRFRGVNLEASGALDLRKFVSKKVMVCRQDRKQSITR